MIKNLLLSAALLLCCCASAEAQQTTFLESNTHVGTRSLKKAPAGALKWGYTLADDFTAIGTNDVGTYGVAIKVPGTGELKGSKVVSINLPVYYVGMKNVSVWVAKNIIGSTFSKVTEKAVTEELKAGYNEITLDTPYEVNGDFFVGYTFTISSLADAKAKYPIGNVAGSEAGSLYINQNGTFVDFSGGQFGMSALQIYLTDVKQDDYDAVFRYNRALITVAGSESSIPVEIYSNGKNDIENIEYTVDINGETTTKTVDVAIPGGFRKWGKADIAFTSPAEVEPYSMKLEITKINGQENSNKSPLYLYGDNVIRKAPYKTLVEEFTGTGCGNCPRGWVGMEAVKHQCSDIAVPIAVHQYNSTDPMYIKEDAYAKLPVAGAPSAVINRGSEIDPYFGTNGNKNYGIIDDVKELANTIPPVDIKLKAVFNADNTMVETSTEVEFLGNNGTYSLEYVVTADELKGTSSAWRQVNYYANRTLEGSEFDPTSEVADFFPGGKYGKENIALTFNDVAIASSYVAKVNTANEMPIDFVAGDKFNDTFTLKMPTRNALKSALQYDKIYANVMVFDENGYCVNAARVRVLSQEEASGIKNLATVQPHNRSTAIYNLAGQRVNANNVRGIYIQNGKKYIK